MTQKPKFSEDDVVIVEPVPGYNDDTSAAIVLEVLEETAGELEGQYGDGTEESIAEHDEAASPSDPLYKVQRIQIADDEIVPRASQYITPESRMKNTSDGGLEDGGE